MRADSAALSHAPPCAGSTAAPLIVHVIYRLDVGGLENGLVNLINRVPVERFRHAIVCLTDYSDFRRRIVRDDVPVYALNKPPGTSIGTQLRLWALLRKLRPAIVHTRNLAALECLPTAAAATTAARIHGEHGLDVEDLHGTNRSRQRLRRLFKPFVHRYVTVSRNLAAYLEEKIGVPRARVSQIHNGVDTVRFHPEPPGPARIATPPRDTGAFVIGTVIRMQDVKDPLNLVHAFLLLREMLPGIRDRLKLAMVGDGPLLEPVRTTLAQHGALDAAWIPGRRDDVADIMRGYDVFVLPSLGEGISNTVLEAMATGLPVVATRVGGNAELVDDRVTGRLVPSANPTALAEAVRDYVVDRGLALEHGAAARRQVEQRFSLDAMVRNYLDVYEDALRSPTGRSAVVAQTTAEQQAARLAAVNREEPGQG